MGISEKTLKKWSKDPQDVLKEFYAPPKSNSRRYRGVQKKFRDDTL